MQKYDVSNFILADFLSGVSETEKPVIERILIGGIVDGWNNEIYFQPKNTLKIKQDILPEYDLM